jgi:hypothetical protein
MTHRKMRWSSPVGCQREEGFRVRGSGFREEWERGMVAVVVVMGELLEMESEMDMEEGVGSLWRAKVVLNGKPIFAKDS